MDKKNELLMQLWKLQDDAYDLMAEYDSIPHVYGEEVLYHSEGQIVDLIAAYPGITCTDIANYTKKTPSACSQLVRKLRNRGLIEQTRNEKNNRIYNIYLTEQGEEIFKARKVFNEESQKKMFALLKEFSETELEHHIQVQKKINEAYQGDVLRSRNAISNKEGN